jgi:hypothetical protein
VNVPTYSEEAAEVFDNIYGRGHGKDMTVSRLMSLFSLPEKEADKLFEEILNDEGVGV